MAKTSDDTKKVKRKLNDNGGRDIKIYKNKYYAWCYRKEKPNLIPIGWYSFDQAKYTLSKTFGNQVFKVLKIIRGKVAIENGWELGVNSFKFQDKKRVVRKYYIPDEYNINRSTRRTYLKKFYRLRTDGQPSTRKKIIKRYLTLTYGRR